MSTSLPSIRECEQQLATLAAVAGADGHLAKAVAVGRALLHYVRNAGTPPVQEPTLKQQAQSLNPMTPSRPYHRTRPPMPSDWHGVRAELQRAAASAPQPPAAARRPTAAKPAPKPALQSRGLYRREVVEPPPGTMPTPRVLAFFSRDYAWLHRALKKRQFPQPVATLGGVRYFDRDAVMRWSASNPVDARQRFTADERLERRQEREQRIRERKEKAQQAPERPAGTETAKELCQRLDRTQTWIYQTMDEAKFGAAAFPRPCGNWGRFKVWSTAEVNAWISRRETVMRERDTLKFSKKPIGGRP